MPNELAAHPGGNVQLPDEVMNTTNSVNSVRRNCDAGLNSNGDAIPEDVANAHARKVGVAIGQGAGNVAPAWFAPALQLIVEQTLQRTLQVALAPINRRLAQLNNRLNDDGETLPFEVVLFLDGRDPTAHPDNLPALQTASDIRTISGVDASRYLAGYGVPVPDPVVQRRRALARAIGCTAVVTP